MKVSSTSNGWRKKHEHSILHYHPARLELLQPLRLRDESLDDSANLPDPDVLAAEIIEGLKSALEQFEGVALDLGADDE